MGYPFDRRPPSKDIGGSELSTLDEYVGMIPNSGTVQVKVSKQIVKRNLTLSTMEAHSQYFGLAGSEGF
jgi:hypothetical protein